MKTGTTAIALADLKEYLDKTPSKTPFAAGSYNLAIIDLGTAGSTDKKIALRLDDVSVKKGNFNKLLEDLGSDVVYRDGATANTYTSGTATTDVQDIYLVISDAE
jgi:hypothetical protein